LRTAKSDLWDAASEFNACKAPVQAESKYTNKTLNVYPNPSNGIFRFDLNENEDFEIEVFNSFGQKINIPNKSKYIDLSIRSNGLYYFEIKSKGQLFRGKIIKID
jgi:hypothetical protein